MPSLMNLEDLILQKQIPFPDREYILTETHYRVSVPVSALSIVNHFTFITPSFQDKFCVVLCKLLERSLAESARVRKDPPELRDVLSRDYGPAAQSKGPIPIPGSVMTWMQEKKFPRLLAFGAIDQIKIEIDQALEVGELAQVDEAKKCLRNLRLCFAKSDHVFDLEEVVQRYTMVALERLETPPEKTAETIDVEAYGILKDFEKISEYKAEDVYPVADDAESQPTRRKQYWVYRFKPEHVRNFGGSSDPVRPRVTLFSSAHTQHYGATFVASFPEADQNSCHAWQEAVLDPFGRPWVRAEAMHIWHYLPTIPTDQQIHGRRLSGSKYVLVPIIYLLRRALELVKRDPRGSVDGTEAPLRNHYLLALARFMAALINSHKQFLIEPTGPVADLVAIVPPALGDTSSLQTVRFFLERVEETLLRVEFPKHNRDFHALLRELMLSSSGRVAIDELIAQFAKPLFAAMFRSRITTAQATEGPELVVSRLASNRAYFISDLVPMRPAMMVAGIIIDVGMSSQQRGRLVQRLGDVGTFRELVLNDLANVRAANDGLAYTALQLSLSQADEVSARPTPASERDYASDADRLRKKMARLQQLQNRLLRYNFLVTSGLGQKATSASTYEHLIERRLAALGEKKAGPHMTLTEFVQRRLVRAEGNIERAARRYSQLEAAILGHLNSIRALHGFAETDRAMDKQQQQGRLLAVGELVAVVVGMYFAGILLNETWGAYLSNASAPPSWLLRAAAVPLVLAGYLAVRWALTLRRRRPAQQGLKAQTLAADKAWPVAGASKPAPQ